VSYKLCDVTVGLMSQPALSACRMTPAVCRAIMLFALQNDACYVSCDGGRVCRPLIICDAGVPRVRQEHIDKLKRGGAVGGGGAEQG
jgi:hypothetical protein